MYGNKIDLCFENLNHSFCSSNFSQARVWWFKDMPKYLSDNFTTCYIIQRLFIYIYVMYWYAKDCLNTVYVIYVCNVLVCICQSLILLASVEIWRIYWITINILRTYPVQDICREDIIRTDILNLAFFPKTKPNMFIVSSIFHEHSSHGSPDSEARLLGFSKTIK